MLQFETHIKISRLHKIIRSGILLSLKRVKLLFHLFLNPPSVIKFKKLHKDTLFKNSLWPYKLFQWEDLVMSIHWWNKTSVTDTRVFLLLFLQKEIQVVVTCIDHCLFFVNLICGYHFIRVDLINKYLSVTDST